MLLAAVLGPVALAADPKPAVTLMAPMRDGVKLATDIYLPSTNATNLPCILMRTPYGKGRYNREVGSMAAWGYAVAIQDLRGRFDSQGKSMGFESDGRGELQDGYDTVQWLAKQPFSNGKVATIGASAMGITQNLMALSAPPALTCQLIIFAPSSQFHEAAYVGGVLRKNQVEGYLNNQAHPDALAKVLAHPRYDEHWVGLDATAHVAHVQAPAVHIGGWYDTFCQGTIEAFLARQERGGEGARGRQYLVMGPWTHGGPGKIKFGEFDLPRTARALPGGMRVDTLAQQWFEHNLRGVVAAVEKWPRVAYYVMGPLGERNAVGNEWRTADRWPVPARPVDYFLAADGEMLPGEPTHDGESGYLYQPTDPTPTLGGRNLYLPAGPMDQRPIERRSDVVTFTTATLDKHTEVTGRVTATIWVSTDQPDTDVALRLCDVYPDGRSVLIAEGIARVSKQRAAGDANAAPARDFARPTPVEVDLWSTSMIFAAGHRIRLIVSSANYPRWEANRNTGLPDDAAQPPRRANNAIHFGKAHPSRLILPVVD